MKKHIHIVFKTFCLLVFVLQLNPVLAQQKITISCTVIDGKTNIAIPGASVSVK